MIAVLYSLITKSQNNWKSRVSGEMDKLNQSALFETENEYGFPEVSSSKNFRCKDLIPFHQCKKMLAGDKDKAVSFFLDDYKFEQVWTRPRDFIRTFQVILFLRHFLFGVINLML